MSCYVPSPLTELLPKLLIREVVRFLRVDCSHYTDFCTAYMLISCYSVDVNSCDIFLLHQYHARKQFKSDKFSSK